MSGQEIPIRVTLSVNENTRQYKLPTVQNTQQYNVHSAEAIGIISKATGILYDTTAHWNEQVSLLSKKGYIYVYSDYSTIIDEGVEKYVPRMKVGDGSSYLIDMPFVGDDICATILDHINNAAIHITPEERQFWNNKSSAFIDEENSEALVLSNTQYMMGGNLYNG